jgi:peroxiredoxin
MMKKVFAFTVVGFLLMASSGFAWPGPGTTPPNFSLPDTNGTNLSLTEFSGKVIFLTFFTSSCSICAAERPRLTAIQNEYGLAKLRVIAVGMQLNASSLKSFARGNSALFLADESVSASASYNINGSLPVNYVIKPDGKVYNGTTGFNETTIKSWIDACVTGVEENANKAQTPKLAFSPNPFKVATVISIQGVKTAGNLQIQDLTGRVIKSFSLASNSTIKWDRTDNSGREVSVGMYFCKLTAGKVSLIQKLVVLK